MKMKKILCFLFAVILFSACSETKNEIDSFDDGSNSTKCFIGKKKGHQAQWMSEIPDDTHLKMLTIPGTHDSGARFGTPIAECQTMKIREQLDAGIRFFDIRCKLKNGKLKIYHSITYQYLDLDDVLSDCTDFLSVNEGETIIMSIRNENDGASQEERIAFSAKVDEYISNTADYWYLGNSFPTLGEARKKIILFRRYIYSDKGINVSSGWADKATFTIGDVRVQDEYNVPTLKAIPQKWNAVEALLDEAVGGSEDMMYVNFCSGGSALAYPIHVAKGNLFNKGVLDYLGKYLDNTSFPARMGCVVMDFPTTEIIDSLIESNFE